MKHLFSLLLFFLISGQAFAWNAPNITSPGASASVFVGATVNWTSVTGSQQYQLQVDTSPAFNSPNLFNTTKGYISSSSNNTDTQHTLDDLSFGTTYYWRVRAYITGDTSTWTQSTFITRDDVTLSSPSDNALGFTGQAFNWNSHHGVDFYDFELDTTLNFNSTIKTTFSNPYISSSSNNTDTDVYVDNMFFAQRYYWRVRARNAVDTSAWSVVRSYNTRDDVTLSSPSDNALGFTGQAFNWNSHHGVDFYDFELDTTLNFNSTIKTTFSNPYISSSSNNTDTDVYVDNMFFGQRYYWRVRARNAVDTSAWSVVRSYNTRDDLSLSSPSDNALGFTGQAFNWNSHHGVDFYDFELDTTLNFNSTIKTTFSNPYISSSSNNTDTDVYVDNMFFAQRYYWRVRARNAVDTSAWSVVRSYNTRDDVTLSSPSDNALGFTGQAFNWNSHHGVDFYDFELDTTLNFNSTIKTTFSNPYISSSSNNTDTDVYVDNMLFGQRYYWRVRARNAVDTSAWSVVRSYNTRDDVTLSSPSDNALGFTGQAFNWNSHHGVDFYDFELDTTLNFNSNIKTTFSNPYISSSSNNTDTDVYVDNMLFGQRYYWRVRARNAVDTSAWSVVRSYNTRDDVTLSSPADNALGFTGSTFNWNSHHGVDFYDFELDTTLNFNSAVKRSFTNNYISSSSNNNDTEDYVDNLYYGAVYYWRVRARNTMDSSAWSTVRIYNTRDDVSLTSPFNNTTNISVTGTTLNWFAHTGTDQYEMQLDSSAQFNSPGFTQVFTNYISSSSNNTDTRYTTGALAANTIYFWRVRSINNVDTSAWTTWLFSTGVPIQVPAQPNLLSPANGATNLGTTVVLDWDDAANSATYTYEYSTNVNFNNSTTGTVSISTSPSLNLLAATTYYWRVQGQNGVVPGPWSVTWSFDTGCNVPSPVTSNATICEGESALLSAAGSQGYNWYDTLSGGLPIATGPSFTFGPLFQSDTLYVAAVDGSCESIRVPVVITVAATPATPVISQIGADSLQASGGATVYEWFFNGSSIGLDGPTIFTNQSGTYQAIAFNTAGCPSDSSATFPFVFVGLQAPIQANVVAYPNPSQGQFSLQLPPSPSDWRIQVFNLNGQQVWTGRFDANSTGSLNLSQLPKGRYVLRAWSAEQRQNLPLMIQ